MSPFDDPVGRVLLGSLWLTVAGFGPVWGSDISSEPTDLVAFYVAGLVAVPLLLLVAYGLGSFGIRLWQRATEVAG